MFIDHWYRAGRIIARPLLVVFVAMGLDEGVGVEAGLLLGAAVSPAPTSDLGAPLSWDVVLTPVGDVLASARGRMGFEPDDCTLVCCCCC